MHTLTATATKALNMGLVPSFLVIMISNRVMISVVMTATELTVA